MQYPTLLSKERLFNKSGYSLPETGKPILQSVVGEVTAGGVRRGGAVLVAPRLALMEAGVLFGGEMGGREVVFSVIGVSTAVVQVWRVEGCVLAELERDMREYLHAVLL
jgi:hypothetical protein